MLMLNNVETITLQAVPNHHPLLLILGVIVVWFLIYTLIDHMMSKPKKLKNKKKTKNKK